MMSDVAKISLCPPLLLTIDACFKMQFEALFDGRSTAVMITSRDATAPSWASSPLFAGGNFSDVLAAKARHQNTQPDDASPAVMSRNESAGSAAADTSEEAWHASSDDVVSALVPRSGTLFANHKTGNR